MAAPPLQSSPTPTIVVDTHPARPVSRASHTSSSDPEAQVTRWVKPGVKAVVKAHPKNTAYLASLIVGLVGLVAGWAVFLTHQSKIGQGKDDHDDVQENSDESDGLGGAIGGGGNGLSPIALVVDAVFILLIIITLALLSRQIFFLCQLFLPPHAPYSLPTSFIPPWLLPPLPTYIDAVGGRPDATGDVEDRYIVGESLPVYGITRGSKLLLRSESRGGATGTSEAGWDGSASAGLGAGGGAVAGSPLEPAGGRGNADAPLSYTQSQVAAAGARAGMTEDEASIERARAVEREVERQRGEPQGGSNEKSRYVRGGT